MKGVFKGGGDLKKKRKRMRNHDKTIQYEN